jgi:hypothetical protein
MAMIKPKAIARASLERCCDMFLEFFIVSLLLFKVSTVLPLLANAGIRDGISNSREKVF